MKHNYIAFLLRISLGWIFLWAFIDKIETWRQGVSPTLGFLQKNAGPMSSFFQGLAGQTWVDWLFMSGLGLIGTALILGIAFRLATWTGCILLILLYLASLPIKNNPFIDEHIIYILALLLLYRVQAHKTLGFGKFWSNSRLVHKIPVLK